MFQVRQITGKHVLFGMFAFFGLIFGANAIFVYYALSTWTGLETRQHYKEGVAYNRILAADEKQKSLGWQAIVDVQKMADGKARLIVKLVDKDGAGLDGMSVQSRFIRPTHEGSDFTAPMEAWGNGRYVADVRPPLSGQWDVRIDANRGGDRYLTQNRVVLK